MYMSMYLLSGTHGPNIIVYLEVGLVWIEYQDIYLFTWRL